MPTHLLQTLSGGTLRSLGQSGKMVAAVDTEAAFDALFACLQHPSPVVVMRAVDVVEKISTRHPAWLQKHKKDLLHLSENTANKQLQWHLALLLPRLKLSKKERGLCWHRMTQQATDKKASRIVRVNSIQALFDWSQKVPELLPDLRFTLQVVQAENIPSLCARIRKINKALYTAGATKSKERTAGNR